LIHAFLKNVELINLVGSVARTFQLESESGGGGARVAGLVGARVCAKMRIYLYARCGWGLSGGEKARKGTCTSTNFGARG